MRSTPVLAVVASALVGIACGVAGGLALHENTSYPDPLGVGAPMVNQPCQDKSLLVVGMGDSRPAIAQAVADLQGSEVRYLATGDSCPTAWNRAGRPERTYVVYQGPFSTQQACEQRMTEGIQGHLVTQLTRGNTEPVQCLCYVSLTEMPMFRPSAATTTADSIFIRALQDLLTHLGRNPPNHRNGVYDVRTQTEIKDFQLQHAIRPNGVVNTDTWRSLRRLGCKRYLS
ncbi:MAG: peptidoglycan-binding domain-containing protein [Catenulispora sp.]